VKTNKDRHILSAVQITVNSKISGRGASFWQHKVCVDICAGSLEEKRDQRTVRSHVNTHLEQHFLAFENNYLKINIVDPHCSNSRIV